MEARVPSVAEAEAVLDGIPVDGRPLGQALVAAANRAAYGESDPARLAAAALWSVARTHPLADGNKRVSLVLADLVLGANGRHLAGAEEDLVQLAARAAAHLVDEDWVAGEIGRLAVAGAPGAGFAAREPEVIRRLADDDYRLPAAP